MPIDQNTGLMVARVPLEVTASIDPDDVVRGLENNDDGILLFITQLLEHADSVDLREQLAKALSTWDEDRRVDQS